MSICKRTLRLWETRFSSLMKPKWTCFASILSIMSGGNQVPFITCPISSQQWSMVVAASCCGGVFHQQGLGGWSGLTESWTEQCIEISWMKTWSRALRTSDWAEGSPSNRTMTLRPQPRQCRSGLRTTLWISLSGPARALTWTQSNISGETWKWSDVKMDCSLPTWQSLRESAEKNGRKPPNPGVQSLSRHTQEAVIAAKGASTKYWVKDLGWVSRSLLNAMSFISYTLSCSLTCQRVSRNILSYICLL